jgi:hypothetical protein
MIGKHRPKLIYSPVNDIKSKQRVADHGEVFTPAWMVEAMLDLVKDKTERIDSHFDTLTLSSTFSAEDSLFARLGRHETFTPMKTYLPMMVSDLAAANPIDAEASG